MATGAGPRRSFLDPAVLARIDNLELLAKTVVDGFMQGVHRSPHLGLSMDFAEHRAYMPGDDIRRIDWRVYARTDRFYIKQFEAETNADVGFLLDVSASMDYRSGSEETAGSGSARPGAKAAGRGSAAADGRSKAAGRGSKADRGSAAAGGFVSKLDYARFLVASLAWFSAGQRDRVGIYAFDDDVVEHVRPAVAHLDKVLHVVSRVAAGGAGAWDRPLARVGATFRRRGILVVASDFYDDPAHLASALGTFRAQGHDVVAFHVLDPAEVRFPFDQPANFRDAETASVLPVSPEKHAAAYRERVAAHLAALKECFGKQRVDYVPLDTSQPLDQALWAYLAFRRKAGKAR